MKQDNQHYHNQRYRFWVTCQQCKHKFGVEPRFVLKFLERVAKELKFEVGVLEDVLEAAQTRVSQNGQRGSTN